MNEIMEWSQGNPGAMTFLMEVFFSDDTDFFTARAVEKAIRNCPTLRGTNLYVWYSDICEKDLSKIRETVENVPSEVLEDACSRQDYSGKKIIEEYLEKLSNGN